jgi:hypothetical protein
LSDEESLDELIGKRLDKLFMDRGVTELAEEYKEGLRIMKQILGEIPEHIKLFCEIIRKELSVLDEFAKQFGQDWIDEDGNMIKKEV